MGVGPVEAVEQGYLRGVAERIDVIGREQQAFVVRQRFANIRRGHELRRSAHLVCRGDGSLEKMAAATAPCAPDVEMAARRARGFPQRRDQSSIATRDEVVEMRWRVGGDVEDELSHRSRSPLSAVPR